MLPITNSLDNISLYLLKGLITIDFIEEGATIKNVWRDLKYLSQDGSLFFASVKTG